MSGLKKIARCALVTIVVFQLVTLSVFAVSTPIDYFENGRIIRIDIADETARETDFARVFPYQIYLSEGTVLNPLEQANNPLMTQYEDVPSYFQNNYENILYGDETVETKGSSITALAMVASYLTGYSYKPDDLSRWFAGKANDDVARLTYASEALGLPFEVSQDWEETVNELKTGKVIIVQTVETSVFAATSHFVVLRGITENGKILVNDPRIENIINEELKGKYETGFEETEISSGFRYAWIFDKSKVPADIRCYTDAPAGTDNRYGLNLMPAEKQLLARVVWANAYGECEEGQQMMVEVILNRLLSEDYPDELKEIICGDVPLCAVELLNEAELTKTHYLVVERALYGPYKLNTDITDFSYICHS